MSKLDELIQKLCTDGVEFKKIKEVFTRLKGTPITAGKMKEIEKQYNSTVYAITHEYLEFGECYSFLLVTDYVEEWEELIYGTGNRHSCFAYVWNKDCEWCSEFGSVGIQSFGGGIKRFA